VNLAHYDFQYKFSVLLVQARTPESEEMAGHCPPALSKGGGTGAEVPFHNNVIGNFVVYQYRVETNLLQLFAHRETSEGFSIISVIIFEVNILLNRNKHNW